MTDDALEIVPFEPAHLSDVLALSVRAWGPVFPQMKEEIPEFVYKAFYPNGWKVRQLADIEDICRDNNTDMWVGVTNGVLKGFIGLRTHEEDSMGEVYVLGVDPAYQRQGIGSALLDFAFDWMHRRGLAMAMVETGDDQGHAPSRAAYEHAGFIRYPVARYFRKL